MAPVAADLIFYPSASSPFDDISTTGGAINTAGRLMNAILTTREKLNYVSSSASDTTVEVTVRGLSFGGLDTIERITLNGTTVIKGKAEFRRILDIALSAAAVGTVTISKQSDSSSLRTVAAGITRYTTLFKFAYPLEGDDLVRYEKVFVKNTHGADALSEAAIALVSDSGILAVGVAASQGDSVSIANRRTAPSGITFESADEYVEIASGTIPVNASFGTDSIALDLSSPDITWPLVLSGEIYDPTATICPTAGAIQYVGGATAGGSGTFTITVVTNAGTEVITTKANQTIDQGGGTILSILFTSSLNPLNDRTTETWFLSIVGGHIESVDGSFDIPDTAPVSYTTDLSDWIGRSSFGGEFGTDTDTHTGTGGVTLTVNVVHAPATCAAGHDVSWISVYDAAPAPETPTLTVGAHWNYFALSWVDNSTPGVTTGYVLEKRLHPDGDFEELIEIPDPNIITLDDPIIPVVVPPPTPPRYCYRIKATGEFGDSAFSSEECDNIAVAVAGSIVDVAEEPANIGYFKERGESETYATETI